MPDVPLARFLPAGWHRLALRIAERLRRLWWRWRKPKLRGAAVAVCNKEGEILLVRHSYRKRDEWHLVTGGVRNAESHREAALRELAEEVGIVTDQLVMVGRDSVSLDGAMNDVQVFVAHTEGPARPDRREIVEACFFAMNALPDTTPEWARRYIAMVDVFQKRSS